MEVVFAYEAWSRLGNVSDYHLMPRLHIHSLVVVDVTLRIGIGLLCSFECNPHEVLTEDIVEDAGTQAAVFLYELISTSLIFTALPPLYHVIAM
jgi:hypothetical protein